MAKQVEKDPNEIVHLQVQEGGTAYYQGKAFGDRGTIQVPRHAVGSVEGPVTELASGDDVPDVSDRPNRPGKGSRVA